MVTFAKKCWNIGSAGNFCEKCDFGLPRHPETIWIHSIFACWRFLMKIHKNFMKSEKRKGALGKSDSTGGYAPYLTEYFAKNDFRKNFKNFLQKCQHAKRTWIPMGFGWLLEQKSQNGENELNFWKFRTFSQLCGRQVLAAGISPLAEARMAHFSTFCTLLHFLALLELSDLQKEHTYKGFGGDRLPCNEMAQKWTFAQFLCQRIGTAQNINT